MDEKNIVAKLSVKEIGCNPKVASAKEEGDKTAVILCRIFGVATGLKSKEDTVRGGVTTAIIGEFEGVNLQEGNTNHGKTFRSGKLYLPAGIQEMVESAVSQVEKDGGSVEFALEIRAVRATNPIGYSYQAVPLIKPRENDALSALRASITAQALPPAPAPAQLPAPAAKKPEPVPAPKKR